MALSASLRSSKNLPDFLDTAQRSKIRTLQPWRNPLACAGSGWRIQVRLTPASPMRRMVLPVPPSITADMAKGFTLYMLKAVMAGRGDELVDLARTNLW